MGDSEDRRLAELTGLELWQVALLQQLEEQADEQGLRRDDLVALARNLHRIDFSRITVDSAGAAEILGVTEGMVRQMIGSVPEFMTPLVDASGYRWLTALVDEHARYRSSTNDPYILAWRKRRREQGAEDPDDFAGAE